MSETIGLNKSEPSGAYRPERPVQGGHPLFRRQIYAILAILLTFGALPSRADESAIKKMDHVGISTANIGRSIHFYRDLLGMELLEQEEIENKPEYDNIFGLKNVKARSAVLGIGTMQIELFEFLRPRGRAPDLKQPVNEPRINHICFEVMDIQKEYQRLKAAGVPFISAPQDFGEAMAVYGRDPDGNVVELVEWRVKPSSGL